MRLFTLTLALASAASSLVVADQLREKVPVFVRSAQAADGFSDPDKKRRDSVKDLVKKLRESKSLRLVDSEGDGWAMVEVLSRETKREANVMTGLFGSKQNKSYLNVRLTAGSFSAEFEGESKSKGMMTGYGDAAGKVVKQLEEWVAANYDRLLALQAERTAGAPAAPPSPQP